MKRFSFVLLAFSLILPLTWSCRSEDQDEQKSTISGIVQKGPFLKGTALTIFTLEDDLTQTGESYSASILSDKGDFRLSLDKGFSGYGLIRADGFYFNEVTSQPSVTQITMFSLARIDGSEPVNVNVFTNLEKQRIEYLVSQGTSFNNARRQARNEVLQLFGFEQDTLLSSMSDITEDNEGGAKLLAASMIIQGFRNEAEMTDLMAEIALDLKNDGVLNNSAMSSSLKNHALYLNMNTARIRNYLEEYYRNLEHQVQVTDFENYLKNFLDRTSYPVTESLIIYPSSGQYGPNILDPEKTQYSGQQHSLVARLRKGMSVKIRITMLTESFFGYSPNENQNWSVSAFNESEKSQDFSSVSNAENCEMRMAFFPGEYLIEYFEMGVEQPVRSKIVAVE